MTNSALKRLATLNEQSKDDSDNMEEKQNFSSDSVKTSYYSQSSVSLEEKPTKNEIKPKT